MPDGYMSRHRDILNFSLLMNEKAFKLSVRASFWLNAYICFKLLSYLRNFPEFSDGDMYKQLYMSPRDWFGLS